MFEVDNLMRYWSAEGISVNLLVFANIVGALLLGQQLDQFAPVTRRLRLQKLVEKARAHIRDRLTQLAPVFLKNKYMLGDGFSMLDVAIAPLLWRLDYYGIELSKNAAPLLKYAERIFSRPAYIEALTPSEKVMRK